MNPKNDDLKPEYDFSQGARGKYVSRLAEGANIVVLDSDVASVFPDSASVNDALRAGANHSIQFRQTPFKTRKTHINYLVDTSFQTRLSWQAAAY